MSNLEGLFSRLEFFLFHFDIRGLEEVHCVFICAIGSAENNARNARIDEDFGAVDAGQVGDVAGGAFGGNAMQRGLDDGVGFCMNGADAMPINHEVADLVAMLLACGRAIEACGEDTLFKNEHAANKGTVTGAAFGNGIGDLQEVGIPVGAHNTSLFRHCEGGVFPPEAISDIVTEIASPPKIKNGGSQ